MRKELLKPRAIVFWTPQQGDKIPVRITNVSPSFVVFRVLAITTEQVIRWGYGSGEQVNVAYVPNLFEELPRA